MKTRKVFICMFVICAIVFGLCDVIAFAENFNTSQFSDSRIIEDWYYDQTTRTLTIGKQSILPDYMPLDAFNAPWAGEKNHVNTLKVESGVTNIWDWSFLSLVTLDRGRGVKSLYLPKSVTRIGEGALEFFFDLTDIYYEGSKEEWEKIIENANNDFLEAANKHYLTDSSQFSRDGQTNLPPVGYNKANPFYGATVGDIVSFGRYEQDGNPNNGREEIPWLVIEVNQDQALVVSQYALDCQPYNSSYGEITWEKCDLRRWLNDTFINTAFSATQRSIILLSDVSADKNPDSEADPGKITHDQVFLLSIKEVEHYFNSSYSRFCKPTSYAVERGSKVYPEINTCWWWTRTPGCDNFYVSDVYGDGTINYIGGAADQNELSVRPAMWIDLRT